MRKLILVTFGGLALLTACSDRSKPVTTTLTNSQVEDSIRARFATDPDLGRANLKVDANVKDQKLTVSGTVPTEADRTRAVEMAKSIEPTLAVTDKIDVKPTEILRSDYTENQAREDRLRAKADGSKIGDSLDDAWLHTKISTKLAADKATPARHINVDVEKNVVTLRGNVDTALAKDEAERIAKETDGVKKVRNLLTVTK